MSETHRSHARVGAARLALGATVLLLAACGASSNPSAATPSAAAIATAAPSAPAEATPTTRPTAPPLPTAIPRPTDMPTDGTCEEGHACLGLLAAKEYHTDLFEPGFAFTMADDRWENLGMTPGGFDLLSMDAPGDAILFFAHPQATKPDGTRDLSVTMTAAGISEWLAANQNVTVGPVTDVSIGGLKGKQMDIAISEDAVVAAGDCPVPRCLGLLKGQGSTWAWDWGTADSEMQRLYVLDGKDGPVLIIVDSLDGTTFDSLTAAADAILASVKFDQ